MLTLQAFLDIQNLLDNVCGALGLGILVPEAEGFYLIGFFSNVLYNTCEYVIPFSFYYLKLGQNYEN